MLRNAFACYLGLYSVKFKLIFAFEIILLLNLNQILKWTIFILFLY